MRLSFYFVVLWLCLVSVMVSAHNNDVIDIRDIAVADIADTASIRNTIIADTIDTASIRNTDIADKIDTADIRNTVVVDTIDSVAISNIVVADTIAARYQQQAIATQHSDVVDTTSVTTVSSKNRRWESLLNWNFIAVPTVSYQPETNWAFGVAAQYYYHCKEQPRNSEVGLDAVYTLNRQYHVDLFTTTYFNALSGWELNGRIRFRSYPDYFYGIGNQSTNLLDERAYYSSNMLELKATSVRRISGAWKIGPAINYRYEQVTKGGEELLLVDTKSGEQLAGIDKYHMIGIGFCAQYDTRNYVNYATKGLFFKTTLLYYEPVIGSSFRAASINVDMRHFVPIYKDFTFAWQFIGNTLLGARKPFEMLPSIGGIDVIRGVRSGVWRDDLSLALQSEFRIPIWRFLKASVFASMGDVYNYRHWQWSVPKIGYGAGLRVAINKSKINLRLDIARQNYGANWSYYITVKEAF